MNAAPNPPSAAPSMPAPSQPEPAPAATAQNGGALGGLISAGLAPATMIACIPVCLFGDLNRDCEQCIDRVLKNEPGGTGCSDKSGGKSGGKEDEKEESGKEKEEGKDDDDEVPVVCSFVKCAEGACRSDS
jgi:hypothetical protein